MKIRGVRAHGFRVLRNFVANKVTMRLAKYGNVTLVEVVEVNPIQWSKWVEGSWDGAIPIG